jgi:hypothetical protein
MHCPGDFAMAMTGNQYSAKEAKQRLEAALRGAFKTPPTPLKDIPKKNGESRAMRFESQRKKTKAAKRGS